MNQLPPSFAITGCVDALLGSVAGVPQIKRALVIVDLRKHHPKSGCGLLPPSTNPSLHCRAFAHDMSPVQLAKWLRIPISGFSIYGQAIMAPGLSSNKRG